MSSMINLKASKKTPTITVGVNPVTNIHVAEARSSTNVHYPGPDGVQESAAQVVERTVTVEDDKNTLLRENKVLRIIIDILHSTLLLMISCLWRLFACYVTLMMYSWTLTTSVKDASLEIGTVR